MIRKLKWAVGLVVFVSVFLTALIGFAHTTSGRPLLPYLQVFMGKPKSCPLGYDKVVSESQRRTNADNYLKSHASLKDAGQKVVPPFEFGKTTSNDVKAFASAHSGLCKPTRGPTELECLEIKTEHGTQSMWAVFDAKDRLINLRSVETLTAASEASARYAQLVKLVEQKVGKPSAVSGSYSATALQSGLLYQAAREYFYHNYFSTLRVTNMGKTFAITSEFNDPEVLR